ncbi:hypothetical protein I5Q34_00495 [Streptomyces sp. AV19]|uniref:hypothetical protein n=1 Tax=Streptomyces sp. AV19 TaxID=2793068 RepID=UPI0018FEDBE6|nr:hypothetical protein [Streptomyces sp. AV19]MBH1932787.1 hypothetical protein [Streptomyces sp. AV19]MDG4531458.1 hypothetical protein [Streptomyces sp. AV19]
MAAKKNNDNPGNNPEQEDLLSSMKDDATTDESFDLLATLDGTSADPWIAQEHGDGIQGVVTALDETTSDFGPEPVPVVTVRTADGSEKRVTAYHGVLRNEIRKAAPQVGDTFACRYFGQKESKSGSTYHHYQVKVVRSTTPPPATGGPVPAGVPF